MGALAFCVFALPEIWRGGSEEYPAASRSLLFIVIGLYAAVIPFFLALWKAFMLLRLVDRNEVFSVASQKALSHLKYCAIVDAVLFVGGVPLLFPIAQADDAPGLILVGMIIACIPVAVVAFSIVFERLVREVILLRRKLQ